MRLETSDHSSVSFRDIKKRGAISFIFSIKDSSDSTYVHEDDAKHKFRIIEYAVASRDVFTLAYSLLGVRQGTDKFELKFKNREILAILERNDDSCWLGMNESGEIGAVRPSQVIPVMAVFPAIPVVPRVVPSSDYVSAGVRLNFRSVVVALFLAAPPPNKSSVVWAKMRIPEPVFDKNPSHEDLVEWTRTRNYLESPDLDKLVPRRRRMKETVQYNGHRGCEVFYQAPSKDSHALLGHTRNRCLDDLHVFYAEGEKQSVQGNVVIIKYWDLLRSIGMDTSYIDIPRVLNALTAFKKY